jgi:hypothetical protein
LQVTGDSLTTHCDLSLGFWLVSCDERARRLFELSRHSLRLSVFYFLGHWWLLLYQYITSNVFAEIALKSSRAIIEAKNLKYKFPEQRQKVSIF